MVTLDRVEMLRSSVSGSEREPVAIRPEEDSVPLATQKQMQTETVRDHVASLRDNQEDEHREEATGETPSHEAREESPEDPTHPQFETILESDFILTTRKTPVEEDEDDAIEATPAVEDTSILSKAVHEEEPMEDGIEVEYGKELPFSLKRVDSTQLVDDDEANASIQSLPSDDTSSSFGSLNEIQDTKSQPDEKDLPVDGTWSFDTTLKRKKGSEKKNIFTGFTEKDVENITNDTCDVIPETEEKEETTFNTIEEVNEEESSTEKDEPQTEEAKGESSGDIPESTDEATEALPSRSMEFDTVLENVAEYIENSDWDAFIGAVTSRPSLATISAVDFFPSECSGFLSVGARENLLLHEVCKNEPSLDAIATLLKVHDSAVKIAGQWGYLPIHCACASGASVDVIKALLNANPESIHSFGDDHMFPLHLACKKGASSDIIQFLVTTHPSACVEKDVYGKTPLDYVLSEVEGPEKAKKLEFIGVQVQSMYHTTMAIEKELKASEEKSMSIEVELTEKHSRVSSLEKELRFLKKKSMSLEGDLTVKEKRALDLEKQLKESRDMASELSQLVGTDREKASVFGENLKKQLARSAELENQLREERLKSSNLEAELKTNCDEWNSLGKEMEDELQKSADQLKEERKRIAELQKELFDEQERRSILEAQLKSQSDKCSSLGVSLYGEREKLAEVEAKYVAAKLRILIEKQEMHEKSDARLAEAYQMITRTEEHARHERERWMTQRNEIYDKHALQMAETHKLIGSIEYELSGKHAQALMEKQDLHAKNDHELLQAYKIVSETEINYKMEKSNWALERQKLLERNDQNLAQAFTKLQGAETKLVEKNEKLKEYEGLLDERDKQIQEESDRTKTLIRQMELAKAITVEKLKGLGDELNLHKSFSESQSKQIQALETSIAQKLADTGKFEKEQQERLAYEIALSDQIMAKINEKKDLMKENEEMIRVLEKSNLMKQELLQAQQEKVEALETARREKENQLKLNQRTMKQLEESIAQKQALEKEEAAETAKLEGTRASRRAAIDIEEDQIKELDYTLARKEALIELEKMKEKTLQQTIAQKREMIDSELKRIKELEILTAEKEIQLASEKASMEALKKAKAEKNAMLDSEMKVVYELRMTRQEKEQILQETKNTEALIQSCVEENENLLAKKTAAIDSVKNAQANLESELEREKKVAVSLEKQIAKKKTLITREEYVARCLQQLAMRKREFLPSGPASYVVNAVLGIQFSAQFGMKSILKETHMVSNFIKTQLREQSAAVRQRRNEVLALVPAVHVPRVPTLPSLGACKSIVSVGPQSLVARLRSFGVKVNELAFITNPTRPALSPEKPSPEK